MKVIYNLTDRKPFVKALEEITGAKALYKKTPTYAYEVDYFTITREGNLTFNDMADSEEIERVLEALAQHGFTYESAEYDEPQPDVFDEDASEETGLTVSLPLLLASPRLYRERIQNGAQNSAPQSDRLRSFQVRRKKGGAF